MKEFKFLTMQMLPGYIHLSKSTIYKKVSNNTIPHTKLGSRTLFEREKIDQWVRNGGTVVEELPSLPQL